MGKATRREDRAQSRCHEPLSISRARALTIQGGCADARGAAELQTGREDAQFRSLFNDLLARSRFAAFRWEIPPITASAVMRHFEFVLLDSPALAQRADPHRFAEHFVDASDTGVAVFSNVGGDAILIAPCPTASLTCYAHFAAFVRGAPEWQQQTLWRRVGEATEARVGIKPVWLSTAGAGVAWMHVRLDDRPKYYGYDPYRRAPGSAAQAGLDGQIRKEDL